jgi:hypothetical protein
MRSLTILSLMLPLVAWAQTPPETQAGAPPPEAAPTEAPPAPEAAPTAPPDVQGVQAPAEAVPESGAPAAGQWVYTNQYGWVWMAHGAQYSSIPSDTQAFPYQYVYYPVYGWRWVVAPWIYGYGPSPYWGGWGPRYFAWYAHPWFHVGGYWGWGGYHGWGNYRGWVGPRAWGGRGWAGAPSYYRTGVVVRANPGGGAGAHAVVHGGAAVHSATVTARPQGQGPAQRQAPAVRHAAPAAHSTGGGSHGHRR